MTTVSTTPRRISTSQAGEDRWVAREFDSNAGNLYLALEMHGAGIHPALSGSSDSNPVSIDLSQRLNRLVPNRPVVRINALDLSLARRRRSDIRAQLTEDLGEAPEAVFAELDTAPLAADLQGDLLLAKGQGGDAAQAYLRAWKGLPEGHEYRRVVQAKLAVLGADPAAPKQERP